VLIGRMYMETVTKRMRIGRRKGVRANISRGGRGCQRLQEYYNLCPPIDRAARSSTGIRPW